MKKLTTIMIVVFLFTLSSCGSSWSCKKRYCDIKEQTKTIVVIEDNVA